MQNMAYLFGMMSKSGFDAQAGNPFRTGLLLKNFIKTF